MLTAASRQFDQQSLLTAAGLREARRNAARGSLQVARVVGRYQAASALLALEFAPLVLAEQGIGAAADGRAAVEPLLTGAASVGWLDKAATQAAFDRLVVSLIADASRTAAHVDLATRRHVTGYVRSLRPPTCSRCAVLAGRVYPYSSGFQRHPSCDCLMTPTNQTVGPQLVTDPDEAVRNGMVRGLSKADRQAFDAGGDLSQIVNVRRKAAGLTSGSSVVARVDRLTPAGIYRIASDKAEALSLLKRYGYVL